jgi:hypothetical protein
LLIDGDKRHCNWRPSVPFPSATSYPGNSAFGRSQRVNHLKGSGNNAHGKTTSAKAKAKHTINNTDD